jgi:hypothetical protein
MSVALSQSQRFALGIHKQNDLATALSVSELVSLQLTSEEMWYARPVNESNKDDKGKGVYATQLFKSHYEAGGPFNGLLTSEAAAIIAAFGLGNVVKVATTATGGFKYTSEAPDFTVDGLDMPSTTGLAQMGDVKDLKLVGVGCEEFGFQFQRDVGRQNAQFTSQWIGTGKHVSPSGLTMPAAYAEHGLNAGGISSLTLIGFNYLTLGNFVSANFGWKNNMRNGYKAGSGNQAGFQLQGRMRRGVPTPTLVGVVECDSGSSEEDALLAQTTGTGEIIVQGDQIAAGPEKHQLKLTFHKLAVKAAPIGDTDGIASYNLEYEILEHPTNGLLTIEVITTLDEILGAAD